VVSLNSWLERSKEEAEEERSKEVKDWGQREFFEEKRTWM